MSHNVAYSKYQLTKVMVPRAKNTGGRVRAGDVMQLIYNAAHQVAKKHSGQDVTAVRFDGINFIHPLYEGEVALIDAFLTFVGKTSMEVEVRLFVKGFESPLPVLTAYITMIALDGKNQPAPVTALEITSEEERVRAEEGKQRYLARKRTRKNSSI